MSSCNLGKIFLIKVLAVLLTSGTVNYPRDNHIRKNRWNQKLTMHVNSTVCAIEHQEQDPLLPIEASFKPYYESKIYQCCYSQPKHIHIIAELNMILKKSGWKLLVAKSLTRKPLLPHLQLLKKAWTWSILSYSREKLFSSPQGDYICKKPD